MMIITYVNFSRIFISGEVLRERHPCPEFKSLVLGLLLSQNHQNPDMLHTVIIFFTSSYLVLELRL